MGLLLVLIRLGHALLAFKLSRVNSPLGPDRVIELGHHILKAHIYKLASKQLGFSSRDMQAYWMCLSTDNLSAALVSHRNLFSPNVKVSQWIHLYMYSGPIMLLHVLYVVCWLQMIGK